MQIEKFNPTRAQIMAAVDMVKNLTIKGVDDEEGYNAVKLAKTELSGYRIQITKFGKKQREEALAWQREVLRQEKELLAMIEPTETKLRGELDSIDTEKKRKEREILLPTRKTLLAEIGTAIHDDKILDMDEAEFSKFYVDMKIEYEQREREKKERADLEKQQKIEMEKFKKETADRAVIEERERVEREKVEQAQKEEARISAEKEDQAKTEKSRKYKAWLKKNGWIPKRSIDFIIQRTDNTFKIFKIIDQITIQ